VVAASSSSDSVGVDLVERFRVVGLGARAGAVVGIRAGTLWDCGGLLVDEIEGKGERIP